jgi:hypothetical protein
MKTQGKPPLTRFSLNLKHIVDAKKKLSIRKWKRR